MSIISDNKTKFVKHRDSIYFVVSPDDYRVWGYPESHKWENTNKLIEIDSLFETEKSNHRSKEYGDAYMKNRLVMDKYEEEGYYGSFIDYKNMSIVIYQTLNPTITKLVNISKLLSKKEKSSILPKMKDRGFKYHKCSKINFMKPGGISLWIDIIGNIDELDSSDIESIKSTETLDHFKGAIEEVLKESLGCIEISDEEFDLHIMESKLK